MTITEDKKYAWVIFSKASFNLLHQIMLLLIPVFDLFFLPQFSLNFFRNFVSTNFAKRLIAEIKQSK